MKITIDKVETDPAHALTKAELNATFAMVPQEWLDDLKLVRMANSLATPNHVATFAVDKLTIQSRGYSKRETVHSVLRELAKNAIGIRPKSYGLLNNTDRSRLERQVAPLVETVMREIASIPKPSNSKELKLNE